PSANCARPALPPGAHSRDRETARRIHRIRRITARVRILRILRIPRRWEWTTEGPMAFSETLAQRIRQRLTRRKNVGAKRLFGCACFLLGGNVLVGVWKDSLIVRLGPDEGAEALKEPHVREFDITGKAMKGWVLIAPAGVEGDDQLSDWIQRAETFVGSLPA